MDSVTLRPQMIGRRCAGTTENASNTSLAACGSTETFHSAVGVVLPG